MRIQNLFGRVLENMWKENEMNRKKREGNESKPKKKSYICYVYGQIYAEYLKSGRTEFVMVENSQANEWHRILQWLTNNNNIEDYEIIGNRAIIKGFNEENKIYTKYLEGIERNIA